MKQAEAKKEKKTSQGCKRNRRKPELSQNVFLGHTKLYVRRENNKKPFCKPHIRQLRAFSVKAETIRKYEGGEKKNNEPKGKKIIRPKGYYYVSNSM